MALFTVGMLREMLKDTDDEVPLTFHVTNLDYVEPLVTAGDVDESQVDLYFEGGYQTSEGDRDVVQLRIEVD